MHNTGNSSLKNISSGLTEAAALWFDIARAADCFQDKKRRKSSFISFNPEWISCLLFYCFIVSVNAENDEDWIAAAETGLLDEKRILEVFQTVKGDDYFRDIERYPLFMLISWLILFHRNLPGAAAFSCPYGDIKTGSINTFPLFFRKIIKQELRPVIRTADSEACRKELKFSKGLYQLKDRKWQKGFQETSVLLKSCVSEICRLDGTPILEKILLLSRAALEKSIEEQFSISGEDVRITGKPLKAWAYTEDIVSHLFEIESQAARYTVLRNRKVISSAECDRYRNINGYVEEDFGSVKGEEEYLNNAEHREKMLNPKILLCPVREMMKAVESVPGVSNIVPFERLISSDIEIEDIGSYSGDRFIAVSRLVYLAGMFGRKVYLSDDTCTPVTELSLKILQEIHRRSLEAYTGPRTELAVSIKGSIGLWENAVIRPEDVEVRPMFYEYKPDIDSSNDNYFDRIADVIYRQHGRNHIIDEVSGKKVSFGFVVFNDADKSIRFTRYLDEYGITGDVEVRTITYHERNVPLIRSKQTSYLEELSGRGSFSGVFEDPVIKENIASAVSSDVMFLVISGADDLFENRLCFNWTAVIEPESFNRIYRAAAVNSQKSCIAVLTEEKRKEVITASDILKEDISHLSAMYSDRPKGIIREADSFCSFPVAITYFSEKIHPFEGERREEEKLFLVLDKKHRYGTAFDKKISGETKWATLINGIKIEREGTETDWLKLNYVTEMESYFSKEGTAEEEKTEVQERLGALSVESGCGMSWKYTERYGLERTRF